MGIKSLTQSIQRYSPESIQSENLYKLSGKKVAVDASLIIYQQLLNRQKICKNNEGKVTNHITGLFYKIMNYISLNIELIFIFDGKPPDNKSNCIKERKKKAEEAIKLSEITELIFLLSLSRELSFENKLVIAEHTYIVFPSCALRIKV